MNDGREREGEGEVEGEGGGGEGISRDIRDRVNSSGRLPMSHDSTSSPEERKKCSSAQGSEICGKNTTSGLVRCPNSKGRQMQHLGQQK